MATIILGRPIVIARQILVYVIRSAAILSDRAGWP